MIRLINIKLTPKTIFFIIFLSLLASLAFMSGGKAYADPTTECGVNTGSESSMQGMIISVYVENDDNVITPATESSSLVIGVSASYDGTPRAAVDTMSSDDSTIEATHTSVGFDLYPYSTCGGSNQVVLGYGATSNNTSGGPSGTGYWALDCGTLEGQPTTFTVSGQGVPGNGIAGGMWLASTPTSVGPNNGGTSNITLVYQDPSPPTYTCNLLGITQSDDTVEITQFTYSATAGATFTNATVDWGDGSPDLTASAPIGQTHPYTTPGTYTITAWANFSVVYGGNESTESVTSSGCQQTVTIKPATYTCTLTSTVENETDFIVEVNFSTTTTGDATFTTATIKWGDGDTLVVTASGSNHTHQYTKTGTYDISATASFTVGSATKTATCSTTVNFSNTPTYKCTLTSTVENETDFIVEVNFSTTTTGDATFTTATIKWGDGDTLVVTASGSNHTHQYTKTGTYDISATASFTVGSATKTATCSTTVSFSNTPTCTLTSTVENETDYKAEVGFSTTEPKGTTFTTATIKWGDGDSLIITTSPSNQTHQYTTYGTYDISATASFLDGIKVETATCSAPVTFPPPTPTTNCSGLVATKVSLPQATNTVPAPTGYTTDEGATVDEEQPENEYAVISVADTDGMPIDSTPAAGSGWHDSSDVTVDLNDYLTEDPYDPHTTIIQYQQEFQQTEYQANKFAYYTCPDGGTVDGTGDSDICQYTPQQPENCTTVGGVETCTCPAGYYSIGSTCYGTPYTETTGTNYYSYVLVSGPTTVDFGNSYTMPQVSECLARTFQLTADSANISILCGEEDYPICIDTSGTVTADFGFDGSPPTKWVENACQVNGITTTLSVYYTTQAAPTVDVPIPAAGSPNAQTTYGSNDCNGSMNITTPTFDYNANLIDQVPITWGDSICVVLTVSPIQGYMNYQGNIIEVLDQGPSTSQATCTGPISAEPYFRAYGGDVMAGVDSNYISACYENDESDPYIASFNQGSPNYNGAGTTLAALANGTISGFASGQGQNLMNMLDPITFANTSGNDGSYYTTVNTDAGNCNAPSYYSQAQSSPYAQTYPNSTICKTTITGLTITAGQHVICLYPSGTNVSITGNITYDMPSSINPNENIVSQLPSFEMILENGSINIDTDYGQSGVSQLDGTYIAQNGTIDDTGADLDICPAADSNPGNDPQNTCAQDRLVVDGAFIANLVDLYRTYGTLYYSTSASSNPGAYGGQGGDSNDAEEFDYYPVNWLIPGTSELNVQSITSLPPVL